MWVSTRRLVAKGVIRMKDRQAREEIKRLKTALAGSDSVPWLPNYQADERHKDLEIKRIFRKLELLENYLGIELISQPGVILYQKRKKGKHGQDT